MCVCVSIHSHWLHSRRVSTFAEARLVLPHFAKCTGPRPGCGEGDKRKLFQSSILALSLQGRLFQGRFLGLGCMLKSRYLPQFTQFTEFPNNKFVTTVLTTVPYLSMNVHGIQCWVPGFKVCVSLVTSPICEFVNCKTEAFVRPRDSLTAWLMIVK